MVKGLGVGARQTCLSRVVRWHDRQVSNTSDGLGVSTATDADKKPVFALREKTWLPVSRPTQYVINRVEVQMNLTSSTPFGELQRSQNSLDFGKSNIKNDM